MFQLVDNYQKGSPRFIPQLLPYCWEQHKLNLERTKTYYRNNNNYINPQHPLAIAINMFDESLIPEGDLIRAYYIAREQSVGIANALGFTHDGHVGKIKNRGLNYSSRNEIYVSVSFDDTLTQLINYLAEPTAMRWVEWTPMKVVEHPFKDLAYDIPTSLQYVYRRKETPTYMINSPKIFHVDLALLFIMYRCWKLSTFCLTEDGDYRTPPNFIGEFVMPNSLESHMNVSYRNRLISLCQGNTLEEFDFKPVGNHGVTIGHVGFIKQQLPAAMNKLIIECKKNPENLKRLLSTLSTLTEGVTLSDLLVSNGELRTHQSTLVYLIPVLKLLYLVLLISDCNDVIVNKFKPMWLREKRRWLTSGVLKVLGEDLYLTTLNDINAIELLLFKK